MYLRQCRFSWVGGTWAMALSYVSRTRQGRLALFQTGKVKPHVIVLGVLLDLLFVESPPLGGDNVFDALSVAKLLLECGVLRSESHRPGPGRLSETELVDGPRSFITPQAELRYRAKAMNDLLVNLDISHASRRWSGWRFGRPHGQ